MQGNRGKRESPGKRPFGANGPPPDGTGRSALSRNRRPQHHMPVSPPASADRACACLRRGGAGID